DLLELRLHLFAGAGVDDHQPLAPHQERTHRHRDAVALVGGRAPLPEDFRGDAEHRATVPAEMAIEGRRQLPITERQRPTPNSQVDHTPSACCFNSTSTPCAADGWTKATRDPWAPERGDSSIRRTPFAFSRARAARMSSTRSVMWCRPGPRFATYFAIGES